LLDLDGNLTPAYYHDRMTEETLAAMALMRELFETVSLATNNERDLSALATRHGFDHVFQPYQPGTMLPYKPSAKFFEHMLETLAAPAETVVMIGDDPEHDVEGASAHGIKTVLIDRLDPYGFFAPVTMPG
jgi:HAD superfamily hydrolase (TIGR01549 family)